ncbi:MAG: dihydroorotate dehydrogenase [Phycisphaerales bacterium]|nr:dihydroorotate dehydrogenase [Phycisphaerales bacterium]
MLGTSPNPLSINLAGIDLRNPVILAAGTAGLLDELRDVLDLGLIGAVTTKSITPNPREGNNAWRILPLRAGMINAIGLANPGLDAFVESHAPRARAMPCKVFVSAAGFSIDDYVAVAANIDAYAADSGGVFTAIELNVSCPNVHTGTEFGSTPALITELLRAVRPVVKHCKLWPKLSPATGDLVGVAGAAISQGVDALTIGNTMPAMLIDVETRRPALSNITGGLSGPALHPVALKHVHDVYRKVAKGANVPIIAAGGVMRWEDAAEFILAGASAFQMGTALFADPRSPIDVCKGLSAWVKRQGKSNIGELVGALDLDSPRGPASDQTRKASSER